MTDDQRPRGHDGHPGWRLWRGRLIRDCDCDASPQAHIRERIPGAPVEICYAANEVDYVVTILAIRNVNDDDDD